MTRFITKNKILTIETTSFKVGRIVSRKAVKEIYKLIKALEKLEIKITKRQIKELDKENKLNKRGKYEKDYKNQKIFIEANS